MRVLESLECAASASLLYLKGGVYMAVESPIGGPNDVVQNNILCRHYGIAGDRDLIPGFRRCIGSTCVGGPDGRGEVSDPYGGSEPSAVGAELPLLRDTWRLRTRPRAGSGSGAVGPVR